jgi:hypothetical protein
MLATLVDKILANHASFLPKPQIPLEPGNFRRRLRQAVLFQSQQGLEAAVFQNHSLRASIPLTS